MNKAMDLRGGPLAKTIREKVSQEAAMLTQQGVPPRLSVVLSSADPAARSYAQSKQKLASSLGITLDLIELQDETDQFALNKVLAELSIDDRVHGILLELPLAPGLDPDDALTHIAPSKDVDGLTPLNLGRLAAGKEEDALLAVTPQACIALAETITPIAGKRVGVIGRGRTVGRPLISMLINRNATVTVCHTRTPSLAAALHDCDILFVAAGRAGLITGEHVRAGQVVIDAGINVAGETLLGDVESASVASKVAALSPVPGGVGPVTSALVFANLIRAIRLQRAGGK